MDSKFYMANAVLLLTMGLILGPGGAASDWFKDTDIGPNGTDFDTDRLVFSVPSIDDDSVEPEIALLDDAVNSSEMEIRDDGNMYYTGEENDRGENYGYSVYNISDRENNLEISYFDAAWYGNDLSLWVSDDQDLSTAEFDQILISQPAVIDPTNYTYMELQLTDEGNFGTSYVEYIRDEEMPVPDEEMNFFQTVNEGLSVGLSGAVQIPAIIFAWLSFVFAIPGVAGYFIQGYMTVFVVVFVIDLLWLS